MLAHLAPQPRLDGRVAAELVHGPGEGRGGRFVAGDEKGHELVGQVGVGEGAGGEGDGEDVGVCCGSGFFAGAGRFCGRLEDVLLLLGYERLAGAHDDGGGGGHVVVAFRTDEQY